MNAATPAGLAAALGTAGATVLIWVGAGVSGGIALFFVVMGIRAGVRMFRRVADGEGMSDYDRANGDPGWVADYDRASADGMSHNDAFDYADTMERDGSLYASDPKDYPGDELGY